MYLLPSSITRLQDWTIIRMTLEQSQGDLYGSSHKMNKLGFVFLSLCKLVVPPPPLLEIRNRILFIFSSQPLSHTFHPCGWLKGNLEKMKSVGKMKGCAAKEYHGGGRGSYGTMSHWGELQPMDHSPKGPHYGWEHSSSTLNVCAVWRDIH